MPGIADSLRTAQMASVSVTPRYRLITKPITAGSIE